VRPRRSDAAAIARVRPVGSRRLPRRRLLACSFLLCAVVLTACESGSSQGTAQTSEPVTATATPAAAGSGGGGTQNQQPAPPAPAQPKKSFFDQIQATGSLTHTEIQHLPKGAACTPRVSVSPAGVATLSAQPDVKRKVAGSNDATVGWDINLPDEAPSKPANIIWNVDCSLSGESVHVGPIVRVWTK
jgi:hypothetical protein